MLSLLACVLSLASGQSDYDYVSECPEENGYFADALQCDRYYECRDGEVTYRKIENLIFKCSLQQVSEHFCPDGLVFDETSTSYAKCGFPFSVDCTGGVMEHVDNNS